MSEKTIGLINLDSGVYMFNETLRYISWKLRNSGYKIFILECGKSLKACTCFNALNDKDIERIGRDKVCQSLDFINSDFHHRIEELENCIEAESFIKLFWEKINSRDRCADWLN